MKILRIVLTTIVLLIVAAYAAYCAKLWSIQREMMFPGAQMIVSPLQRDWPAQARQLNLGDAAASIHAIWIPAATQAPTSTLVFFHGNAEFAFQSVHALAALAMPSRNVLLVEYPGYAGAPGAPTLESIRVASLAAYDWLLTQPEVHPQRIVAVGRSVGGGPAAELSRHRPLAALVLISTFTSIADMARGLYAPTFLIRDPFDNVSAVRDFTGPALILHGRADDVIPYAYGVALGRASPRTEFVTIGCAHNDCALDGAEIRAAVDSFLVARGL